MGHRWAPRAASVRLCRLRTPSVSRSAWAPGLCGGPDVPVQASAPPGGVRGGAASPASSIHDDNNRDLLSSLLWCSSNSLGGSAESISAEANQAPPPSHSASQLQHQELIISKILERKDRQPVKVEFKIYLTENTFTRWEAVVQGSCVYLRMPGVLQAGSKESFILLLDFIEERLNCTNCIICVQKSRQDRATILRTFMFMGFQLLAPNSPLMPPQINNPDYVFLHYNMQ